MEKQLKCTENELEQTETELYQKNEKYNKNKLQYANLLEKVEDEEEKVHKVNKKKLKKALSEIERLKVSVLSMNKLIIILIYFTTIHV